MTDSEKITQVSEWKRMSISWRDRSSKLAKQVANPVLTERPRISIIGPYITGVHKDWQTKLTDVKVIRIIGGYAIEGIASVVIGAKPGKGWRKVVPFGTPPKDRSKPHQVSIRSSLWRIEGVDWGPLKECDLDAFDPRDIECTELGGTPGTTLTFKFFVRIEPKYVLLSEFVALANERWEYKRKRQIDDEPQPNP